MSTRAPTPTWHHPRGTEGPARSPVLAPWQSVTFPMVGNIVVDARGVDWSPEGTHAKFVDWLSVVVHAHIQAGCEDATVSVRYAMNDAKTTTTEDAEGKTGDWYLRMLGRDPEVLADALAKSVTSEQRWAALAKDLGDLVTDAAKKVDVLCRTHRVVHPSNQG